MFQWSWQGRTQRQFSSTRTAALCDDIKSTGGFFWLSRDDRLESILKSTFHLHLSVDTEGRCVNSRWCVSRYALHDSLQKQHRYSKLIRFSRVWTEYVYFINKCVAKVNQLFAQYSLHMLNQKPLLPTPTAANMGSDTLDNSSH